MGSFRLVAGNWLLHQYNNFAGRAVAVSYTHLDVYKRQLIYFAPDLGYGVGQVEVVDADGAAVQADGAALHARYPVSYTHLDVYKRQLSQQPARRNCCTGEEASYPQLDGKTPWSFTAA